MWNYWKRLLIRVHNPWIHAIIGSALVLLSTFATGYWGYQNQNQADVLRAEVSTRTRQIEQSERRRDMADLIATLANIQHFSAGNRRDLDPRLREAFDNVTIANLYESAVRMAEAANKSSANLVGLLQARDRARSGDPGGIDEIYNQLRAFLADAGNYQNRLRSEIDERERRLLALERSRNRFYFIALVLQISGLVFLLIKDVPRATVQGGTGASDA